MKCQAACPHCEKGIEFDAEQNGREASCPHCAQPILLQTAAAAGASPGEGSPWAFLAQILPGMGKKPDHAKKEDERRQLISTIMQRTREGSWSVEAPKVVLLMGEKALWSEPVTLVSPLTIGKREREKGAGLGSAILKRITTSLTTLPSQTAALKAQGPSGRGELIITNHRLVFVGGANSFVARLSEINDLRLFSDGMRFTEKGKAKVRALKYEQPDGDIIKELVTYTLNNRAEAVA